MRESAPMRLFMLVLLLSCGVWADSQVDALFAKALKLNPSLKDYSASLDVSMDTEFGPLTDHPRLTGQYFYKKEDQHQIQLPKAPSYLKRHAKFFGFSLPKLEKYNSRVMSETDSSWRIELIPKVKDANTQRIELVMDKKSYTVPLFEQTYNEDGHLTLTMKYAQSQGYTVLQSAVADLKLPSILLTSHAVIKYGDYAFNKGLSDELFQKGR